MCIRDSCVCVAHTFGVDVIQSRHSVVRCQALAVVAPTGVCGGFVGGVALFLDAGGEEQLFRGVCLCFCFVCVVGVAFCSIFSVALVVSLDRFHSLMWLRAYGPFLMLEYQKSSGAAHP